MLQFAHIQFINHQQSWLWISHRTKRMNRMELDGITEILFSRTIQRRNQNHNPKNQWNQNNRIKRSGAVVCISGKSIIKFAFIGHKILIGKLWEEKRGERIWHKMVKCLLAGQLFDHELLLFYLLYVKQDIDLCSAASASRDERKSFGGNSLSPFFAIQLKCNNSYQIKHESL